jgi:NAD+ kinase
MRVGLHGKDFKDKSARFTERLLSLLVSKKIEIWASDWFVQNLKPAFRASSKIKTFRDAESIKKLDYFISLGGDGTLLDSVTYVGKYQVPILSINTGRLGFLATTNREDAEDAVDCLSQQRFTLDNRSVLKLISRPGLFGQQSFALNDFTIMKKDSSSMITVHVHVDGEFLNSYWADGLIVSTPTGSTGYSLSCGGPLVHPQAENFIITPVSPHNLTARPIILPDTVEITFKVEGRSRKFLIALDSRIETINDTVELKVVREDFKVKLVQLPGKTYFNTLKQKLSWGLDVRN